MQTKYFGRESTFGQKTKGSPRSGGRKQLRGFSERAPQSSTYRLKLLVEVNGRLAALRKSVAQVVFKLFRIANQGDLRLIGKTDDIAWFPRAYLGRINRQLREHSIMDAAWFPPSEES